MELFNLFELKILGYYLRVFRSSREFLLPLLILAEVCLGAYHARPAKRILKDPGAVSRVGRKGGMKGFKYGPKSPWVPTLTKLFPKIQADAGS